MGDRGAADAGFNQHNEGGISLLGTDGKRYVVDESTAQYFYEIEKLVEKEPETPEEVEERTVLAGNALEEAVGHEMALSMDARCSRVMEKFLASCADDDLVRYLEGITAGETDFHTLCKSLFGSRVAEKALRIVCARVGKTPSEALLTKIAPRLVAVADAVAATAIDSAYDPRVSPVARTLLSVLSGRECAPSAKNQGLAGKLQGGTSAAGAFDDAPDAPARTPRVSVRSRAFSDAALAALEPELWNLSEDACGSAFLQAMLIAHKNDVASLNWIIPGFLGCAPEEGVGEGELLANADADDVRRLAESRAGSHLFEAILRAAPKSLMGEIFRRFFRDNMRSLASHPTANFTLQAMLGATRDPEHIAAAMQELGQDFGSLMRERRAGVVAATLAACARLRSGERDAAKSLARGLTAKGPVRVGGEVAARALAALDGSAQRRRRRAVQRARLGDAADGPEVPAGHRAALRGEPGEHDPGGSDLRGARRRRLARAGGVPEQPRAQAQAEARAGGPAARELRRRWRCRRAGRTCCRRATARATRGGANRSFRRSRVTSRRWRRPGTGRS